MHFVIEFLAARTIARNIHFTWEWETVNTIYNTNGWAFFSKFWTHMNLHFFFFSFYLLFIYLIANMLRIEGLPCTTCNVRGSKSRRWGATSLHTRLDDIIFPIKKTKDITIRARVQFVSPHFMSSFFLWFIGFAIVFWPVQEFIVIYGWDIYETNETHGLCKLALNFWLAVNACWSFDRVRRNGVVID